MSELNFQNSEDKELRREENRLTHFEKLTEILGQVRNQLHEMNGSVLEHLEISRKLLTEAEQIETRRGGWSSRSGVQDETLVASGHLAIRGCRVLLSFCLF